MTDHSRVDEIHSSRPLPAGIGEDGIVRAAEDDGLGPANEDEDQPGLAGSVPPQPLGEDRRTPGDQERTMSEDEHLDEALEETFPTSDPIQPKRIDGPNN